MSAITSLPQSAGSSEAMKPEKGYISIRHFDFFYGDRQALYDVNMEIPEKQVTAFIGPSGCGKSTLLRNINRMNDLIDGAHHKGDVTIAEHTIYHPHLEVTSLRKRVGMVFQKSNPFPKSIYDNVIYGLRVSGVSDRKVLDQACEEALRGRPCGTKSRIACSPAPSVCRAASSSACASPARSRSSQRFCSWTSPARPWIRSPPARSKN